MTSSLDADVAALRVNTTHVWEMVTVDERTEEYCTRCGKPKSGVRKPDDISSFLPCRGFIG